MLKQPLKRPLAAEPQESQKGFENTTTQGQQAENLALKLLQRAGLTLLCRNFRTPGRGGGEIDLIVQDTEGTVIFVEVRKRTNRSYGGAGASITPAKQRRLIFAAHHFLLSWPQMPPCRFDAVVIEAPPAEPSWIQGAFQASSF